MFTNRKVFEEIASSYLREDSHWGPDLDVLIKTLNDFRGPFTFAPTYADLGCGPGFHIAAIGRLYPEVPVVGIDFSRRMLWEARKELWRFWLRNVRLVEADILEFAPKAKYSVVSFLNNGFGNLYAAGVNLPSLRAGAIKKIRSLVRENGFLIVSVYNLRHLEASYGEGFRILPESNPGSGEFFIERRHSSKSTKYYSHWFTECELRGLLEHGGFRIDILEKRLARIVVRAQAV